MAGLFGEVLALCADAGLRRSASSLSTVQGRDERQRRPHDVFEQIAQAIVDEQIATDATETAEHGDRRGDELPEILSTDHGRRGWLRAAAQRLEKQGADDAEPIPRSRSERLLEGRRRLEEELDVERQANARYEAYRAGGRMKDGRRFGRPPNPFTPPDTPPSTVSITDPDSKLVHGMRGWIQGFQRPGRLQRASRHPRRRSDDGLAGLWPPRPDG